MVPRMLKDKVITVVIVSLLTFITLSTSVMAANKILGSFGHGTDRKVQSFTEEVKNNSVLTPTSTEKVPSISLPVTVRPTNNITKKNVNIIPTSIPISNPTSNPVTNSNSCIVTIFGKQYDVTTLKSTHSGGDVFTCGTDMTAIYQGRHGTGVNLIAPYLVVTGGGGSTGAQTSTGTNNPQNGQPSSNIRPRYREEDDD